MSILSSFKKALGFPDDYDDDFSDLDELDAEEKNDILPKKSKRHNTSAQKSETSDEKHADTKHAATTTDIESADTDIEPVNGGLAGEIFDAVIELFNATQPDFVRDCLSIESQRTYLLDHIDSAVRAKLEREVENARRQGERQWDIEKKKINEDVEKLKSEYYSLKQQREEYQSAQLSAARQKRALGERIHDLELQVKTLEAEKEQFQLENRSMVNKLRVANVRSSGDENTEAELQRLAKENVEKQDRITELTAKAEADKKRIEELEDRLKQKEQSDDNMIDQQKAIAEIEAQIQQFESIKAKKNKTISDLTAQNRQAAADVKTLRDKLSAAETEKASLSEQLQSLRSTLESERKTGETAAAEMRSEIKRLTELINAGGIEAQHKTKPGRKRKNRPGHWQQQPENAGGTPQDKTESRDIAETETEAEKSETIEKAETDGTTSKISAIDELMDSTDWFIAPEPATLKKDPEVEEEFGYKEPPKKTAHDDDKQLSLW